MNARIEAPAAPRVVRLERPLTHKKRPTALEVELRWNALLGQQHLLQDEIKRGKECLAQAQTDLAQGRARLDEWPTYEQSCGGDCLPHLTEVVSANRRIERYLTAWLRRREGQLAVAERAIARFAREYDLLHL